MVSASKDIQLDYGSVGPSQAGSLWYSKKRQAAKIYHTTSSPRAEATDALPSKWIYNLAYVLPASPLKISFETCDGNHSGDSSPTILAETPMVSYSHVPNIQPPVKILLIPFLLSQGRHTHPNHHRLNLHIWLLRGRGSILLRSF